MSKILFITAASSDIGIGLVEKLSCNYDKLLLHYNNWNNNLDKLKNKFGNKLIFLQANFSSVESINNLIVKIKELDLMPDHFIHLPAPKLLTQKFAKTKWEDFNDGWDISVRSAVILLKAFLPYMQKNKYGKIIFMLTSSTENEPPKFQSSYVTVKYALLGLMKSISVDYAEKGIRVNAVSPDMVDTKFLSNLPELIVQQYEQNRPEKKILSVEDILPTFEFILSEGAHSLNGSNIVIKP